MKYTNRFSAKRLGYSLGMTMMFIIANTLLCIFSGVLIDKYICLAAINICFFLLFMLLLVDRASDLVACAHQPLFLNVSMYYIFDIHFAFSFWKFKNKPLFLEVC